MKRLCLVLAVVLAAGSALAISDGGGGYIYWSQGFPGGVITNYQVYRIQVSNNWGIAVSKTLVAEVGADTNNTYGSFSAMLQRNTLEVRDPRHLSRQNKGRLLQPRPGVPWNHLGETANYDTAWDLIQIDPSDWSRTTLCDGINVDATRSTRVTGKWVTAPEDWAGGASHGLSFAAVRLFWSSYVNAVHDSNTNGVIDNAAAEITSRGTTSPDAADAEMGGDGALYYSVPPSSIYRLQGNGTLTNFFTLGGTGNPVKSFPDGGGIAVGSGTASPIVYLAGMNTNASSKCAIFALKDGDGDKVVTPGNTNDTITAVWTYNDFAIAPGNSGDIYGLDDVEFYQAPASGKKFLVAHEYYGRVWVLELAADGLSAIAGKWIQSVRDGPGPNGYKSGFELDMAPPPPPPLGTMVLLR